MTAARSGAPDPQSLDKLPMGLSLRLTLTLPEIKIKNNKR